MPSRREAIRMSPEELRRYVDTQQTLVIVANGVGGYPHPMPMFFWTDEAMRFHVTTFRKSQKVVNFRRDPKAALLIESGSTYSAIKSMLAYATAEIIDESETTRATMIRIGEKSARLSGDGTQPEGSGAQATAPKRVVIRFTPERFITWDHSKLGGTY